MEPRSPSSNPESECAAQDAGYALSELTPQTLKAAFAGSPFAARIDSEDRCLVTVRNLEIAVHADDGFYAIVLWVLFITRGRRDEVVHFCNRFNQHTLACRAQLRDEPYEDGSHVVIVDYERLTFPEERFSAQYLVRLVRFIADLVNFGMGQTDPGDLVWEALVNLNVHGREPSPN